MVSIASPMATLRAKPRGQQPIRHRRRPNRKQQRLGARGDEAGQGAGGDQRVGTAEIGDHRLPIAGRRRQLAGSRLVPAAGSAKRMRLTNVKFEVASATLGRIPHPMTPLLTVSSDAEADQGCRKRRNRVPLSAEIPCRARGRTCGPVWPAVVPGCARRKGDGCSAAAIGAPHHDATSSYLKGRCWPLAQSGDSRNGKSPPLQVVFGVTMACHSKFGGMCYSERAARCWVAEDSDP